jgi:hypothetical protein
MKKSEDTIGVIRIRKSKKVIILDIQRKQIICKIKLLAVYILYIAYCLYKKSLKIPKG